MIDRPFWQKRIQAAWREAPIAWLSGVRRSGKTTLAHALSSEQALYMNCDLPSSEQALQDPELFFKGCSKPIIIFDEVHQLRDPAKVLKIGADAFPNLKILATGSSTLAASKKFSDSLTGRKRNVHLTPILWDELPLFGSTLPQRLFQGGLPPAIIPDQKSQGFYREWLDSFFARDIQRLFGFRDIDRFNLLLEYVLRQSGGQHDVLKTSVATGISRATVENHIRAMEITHAITLVRPFHGSGQGELTKQPKIYGFDTGFVSFARGWDPLRAEDMGILWEHLVLEHLQAHVYNIPPRYWRDNRGNEIDFVLPRSRDQVDAIECKWNPSAMDGSALKVFRTNYPGGRNYLITPSAEQPYVRRFGDHEVTVCTPSALQDNL